MATRMIMAAIGLFTVFCCAAASSAQEPGWESQVLVSSPEREYLRSVPMVQRPYRPGHVVGNTVRRQYYRGFPLPLPRDFSNGAAAFLRRR